MEDKFGDWLREWHMRDYQGTDDDAPDAFDAWVSEMNVDDLIKLGSLAMRESELRGFNEAKKIALSVVSGK